MMRRVDWIIVTLVVVTLLAVLVCHLITWQSIIGARFQ